MFKLTKGCTVGILFSMALFGTGVATAQELQIPEKVSLDVGQSAVIHGVRSECGKDAPDWEKVAPSLPSLVTGTFSDGGLGTRYSRRCSGPTPARAVRFTATTTGTEKIDLFGDQIRIEVR